MVKEEPVEEEHTARSYGTYLRKFRARGRIADVAGGRETVLKCLLNVAENND